MVRQHRAAVACLTFCILVSGCGKGGNAKDPPQSSTTGGNADGTTAQVKSAAAVTTVDVDVQMTGLLLIVPPKQTGTTYVFLPNPMAKHYALFGFGIPASMIAADVARLCSQGIVPGDLAAGMCYVNLDDWKLEPFTQGTPPSGTFNLDQVGLMNLTTASGGFKVTDLNTSNRARLQFDVGAPAPGKSCKLARWRYRPALNGQPGPPEEKDLANVVHWMMKVPATFELNFKPKTVGLPVRVPLVANTTGSVQLILAHIPEGDVGNLPPGQQTGPVPAGSDTANHFHSYYDILNVPPSNPGTDPRRPIPHVKVKYHQSGCQIDITTKTARADTALFGPRTYACMPAAAEIS